MSPDVVVYVTVQMVGIGIMVGVVKTQLQYIEKTIEKLEKKQEKYNNVIKRTYKVEGDMSTIIQKIDDHIENEK